MNDTKLSDLTDEAFSMKEFRLVPLYNAPENNDIGEEHDGKEFM